MKEILTTDSVAKYIGKRIEFHAPSAQGNHPYVGEAIIKSIDLTKHNPLTVERLSGDDLRFAFVDTFNSLPDGNAPFAYSDGDRFIEVEEI